MWASAEWCWGPGNKKSRRKLRYLVPSLLWSLPLRPAFSNPKTLRPGEKSGARKTYPPVREHFSKLVARVLKKLEHVIRGEAGKLEPFSLEKGGPRGTLVVCMNT